MLVVTHDYDSLDEDEYSEYSEYSDRFTIPSDVDSEEWDSEEDRHYQRYMHREMHRDMVRDAKEHYALVADRFGLYCALHAACFELVPLLTLSFLGGFGGFGAFVAGPALTLSVASLLMGLHRYQTWYYRVTGRPGFNGFPRWSHWTLGKALLDKLNFLEFDRLWPPEVFSEVYGTVAFSCVTQFAAGCFVWAMLSGASFRVAEKPAELDSALRVLIAREAGHLVSKFIWLVNKLAAVLFHYAMFNGEFLSLVDRERRIKVDELCTMVLEDQGLVQRRRARERREPVRTKIVTHPDKLELHDSVLELAPEAIPDEYKCPISKEICRQPTQARSGQTYDLQSILEWIRNSHGAEGVAEDPITRDPIDERTLVPNFALRSSIMSFNDKHAKKNS